MFVKPENIALNFYIFHKLNIRTYNVNCEQILQPFNTLAIIALHQSLIKHRQNINALNCICNKLIYLAEIILDIICSYIILSTYIIVIITNAHVTNVSMCVCVFA